MTTDQDNFFQRHVLVNLDQALSISETTKNQNSKEWVFERSKRIKASKAYELYTEPDWFSKISKQITPSKYQSAAMKHGIATEPDARLWYANQRNVQVDQLGFTIHPNASFIECSPDGVVFNESRLLEVKCPCLGQTQALTSANVGFLHIVGGAPKLRPKHIYILWSNNEQFTYFEP